MIIIKKNKYFGTDGIRGKVGSIPITPEFITKIGWAVAKIMGQYGSKKIIIGTDTRKSSYLINLSLQAGILSTGSSVLFVGIVPTPAISYLTKLLSAQAGIAISASHNSFHYNGVKFFSCDGTKINDKTEKKIERKIKNNITCNISSKLGTYSYIKNAPFLYIDFCKKNFSDKLNLKNIKIILDCANGSTFNIAPIIFNDLGANITLLGCSPDGENINKNCGTNNVKILKSKVLSLNADLGIAFDGDGDRLVMIDHRGNLINGDHILYIIAREELKNNNILFSKKSYGVVGTVMSNMGLELSLKEIGIKFIRSQVGDKYILEKLKEKKWYFGAENSGHIILLNKSTTGDAIIAVLQVLTIMINNNSSLYDLCKNIKMYPHKLLNIKINNTKNIFKIKKIINNINYNFQGLGRAILRFSGTEPLIRIMVEGKNRKKVFFLARYILKKVKTLLSKN